MKIIDGLQRNKTVWLLILLVFVTSVGCQKEKPKEVKKSGAKMTVNRIDVDEEESMLLSMKYKVDEAKVINLLKEYEAGSFNILFGEKGLDRSGKFKSLIAELSSKYNIPEDKLVSLIIDYKMLESRGAASE